MKLTHRDHRDFNSRRIAMKTLLSALLVGSTILVSAAAHAQEASSEPAQPAIQSQSAVANYDRSAAATDKNSYGSTTFGLSQSSYSHSPKGVIPFVENNSLYSHR